MTDDVTRIPDHAPQPQDHKKKKSAAARAAEAGDGYITIEQCGVELRIPIKGKVPTKAMLRFRNLNDDLTEIDDPFKANMMGTRELLDTEQWEKLLAANPCAEDFQEIGKKIQEASGND